MVDAPYCKICKEKHWLREPHKFSKEEVLAVVKSVIATQFFTKPESPLEKEIAISLANSASNNVANIKKDVANVTYKYVGPGSQKKIPERVYEKKESQEGFMNAQANWSGFVISGGEPVEVSAIRESCPFGKQDCFLGRMRCCWPVKSYFKEHSAREREFNLPTKGRQ